MKITLLDTKTGNKKTFDWSGESWYWREGDGSCDCNRAIEMDDVLPGCDDELDAEMREAHPELKEWQSCCYGAKRILIVKTDCDECSLEEFNANYPKELLTAHLHSASTEDS